MGDGLHFVLNYSSEVERTGGGNDPPQWTKKRLKTSKGGIEGRLWGIILLREAGFQFNRNPLQLQVLSVEPTYQKAGTSLTAFSVSERHTIVKLPRTLHGSLQFK